MENLEAIKKALKTGKEIEGKIKKKTFLRVFKLVSRKRFKMLKLKKKK